MKSSHILAAAAALASTLPLTAAQADAVRPGIVALPSATSASLAQLPAGARIGARVGKQQSSLLGAPLFLIFLGAVAITIGTIIIVNNSNNSPG